jgi:hypothetical protein
MSDTKWTNVFLMGILAILLYKFAPGLYSAIFWIYMTYLVLKVAYFLISYVCKELHRDIIVPARASYMKFTAWIRH